MNKSYQDLKDVEYYLKEREHFGWRPRGERLIKFSKIKSGDDVLDLCCGPGMVAKVTREVVKNKGQIIGIDYSKRFISYAKKFCRAKNVEFFCDDVLNLDQIVGSQKFDVVHILASWFWIPNKEILYPKILKVLKPDGRFVISLSGDNLNDSNTNTFFWSYRQNLEKIISSSLSSLRLFNDELISKTITEIESAGFSLVSKNETKRFLTIEDKLFCYQNPSRTTWIGDYSPRKRFSIIKKALLQTQKDLPEINLIERHTFYLVFKKV